MRVLSRAVCLAALPCIAFCVATASAGFIENFESYPAGGNLGAPWVGGFQFGVLGDIIADGFGGSNGFHSNGPDWNDGDRATNYDTNELVHVLSWKARLDSANGQARLSAGAGNAAGHAIFEMRGIAGTLTGVIEPPPGNSNVPVAKDTWYEMTVTFTNDGANNWSWVGNYAAHNGVAFGPPDPMGSGVLPAGFAPDFVNLQSIFAFDETPNGTSALDDVGFDAPVVPEPASMALLAVGGVGLLLHRRRKRSRCSFES